MSTKTVQMKRVIIGDVHGCTRELCELLDKLDLHTGDWVCFVGDLIDKGPDPVGTVARAMILKDQGIDVELVLGNHEWKFLRALAGRGVKTSTHFDFTSLKEHCEQDHAMHDFLLDSKLYVSMFNRERPRFPGIVVHAGFPPDLKSLPPAYTARQMLEMKGRDLGGVNRVTFCRYVDPAGHTVMLGKETEHDSYWADTYTGRFKHVFFGHQPFLLDEGIDQPHLLVGKQFPEATGMDLGCVYGGHLCAAVIDMYNTVSFVTVKAHGKYASTHEEKEKMSEA